MKQVYIETYTGLGMGGVSPDSKVYEIIGGICNIKSNFMLSRMIMNMFLGLSVTNLIIRAAYGSWLLRSSKEIRPEDQANCILIHDKMCFYFVHDLRVFVDMAVSVLWILDNLDKIKIEVDGIDAYVNPKSKYRNNTIEKHLDFLKILRLLDNGQKHSLINYSDRRLGKDEPCVYGVYNNHNDYSKPSDELCVEIWRIVDWFNSFNADFIEEVSDRI